MLAARRRAGLDGDPARSSRAASSGARGLRVLPRAVVGLPGGMGYGDVRLSALVGFVLGYLGWAELLVGVYGAFLVFAVLGRRCGRSRAGDRSALRDAAAVRAVPAGRGARSGVVLGSPIWGISSAGDRRGPAYRP